MRNKYAYAAALWALAILAVSTMPGNAIEPAGKIPFSSTVAHVGEFLILGWLLSNVFSTLRNPLAISIFYSAFTEFLQLFVPGRFFSYNDIALNIAGAVFGICAVLLAQNNIFLQLKSNLYAWFDDRNSR